MTVTATNTAVTSNTFTINGSTRTWTNASSSTTILTNLVSKNHTATNLFNNFADFPIGSGITHEWLATNQIRFIAPFGAALSGSIGGDWGTISLITQAGPVTYTALWPIENMVGATNRTNQASSLVSGLSGFSTNAFATNATANSNFVTKGATVGPQYIISELRISGNINNGTARLSLSNVVNYGAALRSEGSGGNSFQVGSNAQALGSLSFAAGNGAIAGSANSLALGNNALATNINTTAIGVGAQATNQYATAVGAGAQANGENSFAGGEGVVVDGPHAVGIGDSDTQAQGYGDIAIGSAAVSQGGKSIAIGVQSSAAHTNSTAIGYSATTTTTNQVRIGTSAETVSIPGMLSVSGTITNATLRGTNIINGQIVYTPALVTSLANGYNAAVAVNQAYIRFSGPSAAYTNVGFSAANKMDGRRHLMQFDNPGLSFTILHDSGLDSGPTNRIYTGTGALVNSTNNPVFVEIIRDESVDRWRLLWIR